MVIPGHLSTLVLKLTQERGVSLEQLRGIWRNKAIVDIRREVAVELRKAGASYTECGELMNRDHSTVINLIKKKPARKRRRAA